MYGAIVADILSGNSIFVKWAKAEFLFESCSKPKPTLLFLKPP